MTHIAVERNRRRQMNEYLAALRSLMPESYAHRGDQASIVGGAIDFVKELEQLLQSLEAQKRTLLAQQQQDHKPPPIRDAMPSPSITVTAAATTTTRSGSGEGKQAAATRDGMSPPFAGFFTYPQFVCRLPPRDDADDHAGAADIEVTLVETHASVRVMAPRRPGQLLRMVAGMEALRLTVLHLNVTTLGSLALYSLSVKVEEGCGLTTADDIAASVHHVLCLVDAEATSQRLLAGGQQEISSQRHAHLPPHDAAGQGRPMRSTVSKGPPAPASADVARSRPKLGRDAGCCWIWRTGAPSGEPEAGVGRRTLPGSRLGTGVATCAATSHARVGSGAHGRDPMSVVKVPRVLASVPAAEIRHSVIAADV
uniref:Transcription factor bHLH96 n=1 Tax=Aegilops tauschii TaxID=37682 RepID=R7WDB4_AEGTA